MSGAATSKGTGFRSALRHRDLRLLFGSMVVSATGSWAYNVALMVFVYDRTQSLAWVSAASLGRFVPALLLSAYAGVVAERFERVRVMVSSDIICCVLQAALAVVVLLDGSVTLAIVLAGLTAVASAVYLPSVAAMIPQVVEERDLAAANALEGSIENITVIAGPAIGAFLVAFGSAELALAVNAATFAVSALLVRRMTARSTPVDVAEDGTAGPLRQMIVGAKAIFASAPARVLVAFCALASFVYGTDTVLFVAASDERLGTGPDGFGYLLAGMGVGGVLMAAAVNRLAGSTHLAFIITAGMAVYCLPTALLAVVDDPEVAFAIQVVRGAGTLVVDVLAITALQRSVADDVVARVFGVFFAFVLGAIALGALIAPPVVSLLGLETALVVFAVGPVALALLGLPSLIGLDRTAQARVAELAPRIAVLERLGIFAAASRPVLERLGAALREVDVAPGTAIIREGEDADDLYVLVSGKVAVASHGEAGGPDRPLGEMGPGTYFGEIGLLEHIPRTATVTATEDCHMYRLDGDAFLDALTSARPAASFVEGARRGLSRTHPSAKPTYEPEPEAEEVPA